MKKKILCLVALLIILIMTGCNKESAYPTVEEKKPYAQELLKWLPKEGNQFKYSGSYDYLHSEQVSSIEEDIYERVYRVEGEVSSNTTTPTTFTYTYTVTDTAVVRRLSGFGISDDKFLELTLLKLPLTQGATWEETVKDAYGNTYNLVTTVKNIESFDGKFYMEITYEDVDSDYFEARRFESGTGVIYCAVQYAYGDAVTELVYDLVTTYIEQEEVTVDREPLDTPEEPSQDNASKEERQAITELIQDFNEAWILYVNDDDLRVFEYLVPGKPAYISVNTFNREGLRERFVLMDVGEIEINGNDARVIVREEIEHIRGDEAKIISYEWVYEIQQFNGIWLIVNYYDNR